MPFDLPAMTLRARVVRKKSIRLRDIVPPQTFATDLFRESYLPVVEVWQRATPRIIAEYERAIAEQTTDSPADVQREITAAEGEATRLFLLLDARVRDFIIRLERWHRQRWSGAVLSASGVSIDTLIGPEDVRDTVQSYIAWNTDLIRDVSAQAKQRIAQRVFAGLTQRTPARELAKDIREIVGMSRRRSIGIASDQLAKISGSLDAERRRQAGISCYEHKHSGKRHPRVNHLERDGHIYSENPEDVGKRLDGKVIRTPVAPNDRASVPPWCGCRELACMVFSFDGED